MSIRRIALAACSLAAASLPTILPAKTVAWWRFENGLPNEAVTHATAAGAFDGSTPDVSGNGNHLSAWSQGGGSGFAYRADVPFPAAPQDGTPNLRSIKNTGSYPAAFTDATASAPTGVNIDTFTPPRWTVEVCYKPEITGGHRTVLGRDARDIATGNGSLAALYLQIRPDDSVGIAFTDVSGYFHSAFSPPGWMYGFVFGSDPEGTAAPWYRLAATCDGSMLKMYVDNVLVASTDLIASGSPNRALAKGSASGGDWKTGAWSVGRGLYGGGHVDRAYGLIDEVRISDEALPLNRLLGAPQPGVVEFSVAGNMATAKARGGAPGGLGRLYQSSDLSRPVSQWTPVGLGTFNANGAYDFNTQVDVVANPRMFYRVSGEIPPPPAGAMTYSMGWGWENAPAGARDNMVYVMNGVVAMFNRYGTFAKHLRVNYSPGVQTAQAGYGGDMDFGPKLEYHNFRTALHEAGHALGVGTTWQWGAQLNNGVWQGTAGRAQIKAFDGAGAEAYSDGTHYWPYGMNYNNEAGTVNFYRAVQMIAAFRRDMGIGP